MERMIISLESELNKKFMMLNNQIKEMKKRIEYLEEKLEDKKNN